MPHNQIVVLCGIAAFIRFDKSEQKSPTIKEKLSNEEFHIEYPRAARTEDWL